MTLHTKWLNINFETPFCRSSRAPHLQEIVRVSQERQIRQHENAFHLSPQKALVQTTKKILNIKQAPNKPNLTIAHFGDALNKEEKKRAMTSLKNRTENKASLVKKQLELFNEINRSLQRSKIVSHISSIETIPGADTAGGSRNISHYCATQNQEKLDDSYSQRK